MSNHESDVQDVACYEGVCIFIHLYACTLYQICLYQTARFHERYIPVMAKMQNFVSINILAIQILWSLTKIQCL